MHNVTYDSATVDTTLLAFYQILSPTNSEEISLLAQSAFLVGKPEGKRPLGRPRRRWEDNIKMDIQEVGGGCGDWMELAQDRDRWRALVGTVRNLRVPKMRGIS
jgi:hypothetical protein